MAAATSAAISMKMLWMSAILYDKISPQKRLSKTKPAFVSCEHTCPKREREPIEKSMHVASGELY